MPAPPEDAPAEKLALAFAVVGFWLVGYYGTALRFDPTTAHVLRTAVDDAIPLVPETIYVYASVYTAMLLPLFVVRCRKLFRRVVTAYVFVIGVSLLFFNAMPVTALGLRPDAAALAALDGTRFAVWGLRLNYALDPPLNLFPSLHLASVALVALSASTARRGYAVPGLLFTVGVAIAICTVKQHWIADGLAGLALGAAAWALFVRSYERARAPGVAYGAAGPLTYLVINAVVVSLLYGIFLSGVMPLVP